MIYEVWGEGDEELNFKVQQRIFNYSVPRSVSRLLDEVEAVPFGYER